MHIGPERKEVIPALVPALKRDEPMLAALAAEAPGSFGSVASTTTVPALREHASSANRILAQRAREALKQIVER